MTLYGHDVPTFASEEMRILIHYFNNNICSNFQAFPRWVRKNQTFLRSITRPELKKFLFQTLLQILNLRSVNR